MGIPFYFSIITKQYPKIIKKYSQVATKCNKLFIDFNAIIHQASGMLKNELKLDRKILNDNDFEKKLYVKVCDVVDNIYNSFDNSELNLIYCAFDGIPPFAKTIQQKKRRFNTAHITKKKLSDMKKINVDPFLIEFAENEWNSSNISTQTDFMNNMSKILKEHMKINYTDKIKGLDVIISDTTEFGEGEHKIFQYLKTIQEKEKAKKKSIHQNNQTIFIHGLDADLILLSMINLNNYNIYLMREQNDIINYLFINEFKQLLINHLIYQCNIANISIENLNDKISIEELLIMNYSFICVFLGNDFLPHLSYISLENNGLDTLINSFSNLIQNEKKFILNFDIDTNKFYIDFNILNKFFEYISNDEDKLYKVFVEKYINLKQQYGVKNKITKDMTLDELDKYYKNYAIIHKQDINLFTNLNSWRINYYNLLFPLDTNNNIQELSSINYIEGLNWYVDYYFNQNLITTGWFYKYNYSPTLIDLYLQTSFISSTNSNDNKIINILDNNKDKYVDYELGKKKNDYIIQLFYILPYNSRNIINKLTNNKYNYIYDKMCLGFYYPNDYQLITYMKKHYYEGIPNIPFLDIKLLTNIIDSK
jgi:5'-3' exonuclease